VKKDKSDKGKSLKDIIAKQQDRIKREKEIEENKPDWLKQIDSMDVAEIDKKKADKNERIAGNRLKKKKKKDDEYARKMWWDKMDKPTQEQYIRDNPKSKEAKADRKKRKMMIDIKGQK